MESVNDGWDATSNCPDTFCHGTEEHGQSRTPSSDTLKTASASGRFGESISRAIRFPPFDLRKIGRASCRERVQVPVVDGGVEKKKENESGLGERGYIQRQCRDV